MPRGKHSFKPRVMRRIREKIERHRMRIHMTEQRRKKAIEKQRKEKDQRVLEARVNNERRREEQRERVNQAIRKLAQSVQ